MLDYAFMQRALAAALGVGLVCGVLGFFVVLRRLAFVGMGISHAAVGGVAAGLWLGVDPLACAAAVAVLSALAIAGASRRGGVAQDVAIGVVLSGALALGMVLLAFAGSAQADLFGYLFGSVLALRPADLAALAAAGAAVLGCLSWRLREILFVSFDEETARAYGHPTARLDALLLVLVALTVVIGVRLVGILLVHALLVVPAASAALWAARYPGQIALAAAFGAGSGALGLGLSWTLDWPAGAAIALVAVALYGLSLALRRAPA
jgi:zinc transport system permease protein